MHIFWSALTSNYSPCTASAANNSNLIQVCTIRNITETFFFIVSDVRIHFLMFIYCISFQQTLAICLSFCSLVFCGLIIFPNTNTRPECFFLFVFDFSRRHMQSQVVCLLSTFQIGVNSTLLSRKVYVNPEAVIHFTSLGFHFRFSSSTRFCWRRNLNLSFTASCVATVAAREILLLRFHKSRKIYCENIDLA